jgi:hypothetical protein
MTTTPAKPVAPLSVPSLSADLDAGLRRLKLAAIRRTAPEVLLIAKTNAGPPKKYFGPSSKLNWQHAMPPTSSTGSRWPGSRSPRHWSRSTWPAPPVWPKVFDHLSSLEWIWAQQNLAIIGLAGTGKSRTLIGLGVAAIHAGHKVRYFTAADLVETPYRGQADNTVGKIIESLLRVDPVILDELGFAPLDDTGTQLRFRLVAGA